MGRSKQTPERRPEGASGTTVLTEPGVRLEAQKAMLTAPEADATDDAVDSDDLVDSPPSSPKHAKRQKLEALARRQADRQRVEPNAVADKLFCGYFNAAKKASKPHKKKRNTPKKARKETKAETDSNNNSDDNKDDKDSDQEIQLNHKRPRKTKGHHILDDDD